MGRSLVPLVHLTSVFTLESYSFLNSFKTHTVTEPQDLLYLSDYDYIVFILGCRIFVF